METHSSILAWRIQWTEDHGGLQSLGSQSGAGPVEDSARHKALVRPGLIWFLCTLSCPSLFPATHLFKERWLSENDGGDKNLDADVGGRVSSEKHTGSGVGKA